MFREASIGRYYEDAPLHLGEGVDSWITRGANFAVVCSRGAAGATFKGTAKDEQFVYALEGGVVVSAGSQRETLGVEDLAILPPGDWTVRFERAGLVVQQITADEELAQRAPNGAIYAKGASEVAAIEPWPEPVGGYRLRRYSTLAAYARGGMVHAFRTRKLMMVPYARFLEPRDETALTPHSHADFEQGSVALEGEWLHHLRVPWTANRREWRPDVHLQVGSPSTTIIPAGVIHTSQGIAGEGMRLIDVFAPPRMDFSQRGWVDNAADYPMPGDEPPVIDWLKRLEAALAAPTLANWAELFDDECYWRDLLAFTWDIVTLEGRAAIAAMVRTQGGAIAATGFAPDSAALPMSDETQGWFTFSTATARCRGHVQLRGGRAFVLLTAMVELIGHEEIGGPRRPDGIEHRAEKGRRTWLDRREESARTLGRTEQPYCLIVGGGQNGLMLAARLKRLGVPTLVIDALEKPGDGWRVRYRSLYLHDPIFLDHFPYLPFPDHWPLYTSKDKIADWLEIYAKAMEIDFWGNAVCTAASYDEPSGEWTVAVTRNGESLTLRPKQLVLATGLSGAKYTPAIPGAERFSGRQYHSADHGAGEGVTGKNCVVIGSNNSAHDICVDLWEHDAQVTMIQRSPTIVVRADTMREGAKSLYYAQPEADVDFADLMGATQVFRPRLATEKGFTDYLRQIDAAFYERLAKSGFQLWHGEDETGFFMAYYRRAAGYYIDVGGSELIATGEIQVRHGEIAEIVADGLRMADGTFLPADVIVYATGYRPMKEWVSRLISPEVARNVGHCWGLGSGTEGDPGPWEGELRNMWKPTAQQALWFQGGNLMQSRFHSLHLALQLKARMAGVPTPVYRATRTLP